MIFSELYSTYYNTVARILKAAIDHPLSKEELRSIIEKNAFGESILNIEPAIMEERWQVLAQDGSTALKHTPTMPLTLLEKRWLKAIFQDPRIKLFTDEADNFPEVEPLFRPDDIHNRGAYSQPPDPMEQEIPLRVHKIPMPSDSLYPPHCHSPSVRSLPPHYGIHHIREVSE